MQGDAEECEAVLFLVLDAIDKLILISLYQTVIVVDTQFCAGGV